MYQDSHLICVLKRTNNKNKIANRWCEKILLSFTNNKYLKKLKYHLDKWMHRAGFIKLISPLCLLSHHQKIYWAWKFSRSKFSFEKFVFSKCIPYVATDTHLFFSDEKRSFNSKITYFNNDIENEETVYFSMLYIIPIPMY